MPDNVSLRLWETLLPMVRKEIEKQTQPCIKSKLMTVSTPYNQSNNTVGVIEPFGTEVFLPVYGLVDPALLTKGATVWVYALHGSYSNAVVMMIGNAQGKIASQNIKELAINNSRLDYDSVSNAKIRENAIMLSKLNTSTVSYLIGGPYMSVSYDGNSRLDITQGKHVYKLRKKTDASINLDTWLINEGVYDGVTLFLGTDIEAPIKMLNEEFVGGIHGYEQMNEYQVIADGVDITGSAYNNSSVKTMSVFVASTIYAYGTDTPIFTREKLLSFSGSELEIRNNWTYTGAEAGYVEKWPGCGLYSVFSDNSLGYSTNTALKLSKNSADFTKATTEASIWVSGAKITMRAGNGKDGNAYSGGAEILGGGSPRIKVYFDTIYQPTTGYEITNGEVLNASFVISVDGL